MERSQATAGMSINQKLDYYTAIDAGTGCWLWRGTIHFGYGKICINGKNCRAHRLSWERHNGPIPEGLLVCHKCDVRHCINPSHLFIGTQKDNIQDASQKGSKPQGENHKNSKTTEATVLKIRIEYDQMVEKSQRELAKKYRMSQSAIWQIVTKKTWRHI